MTQEELNRTALAAKSGDADALALLLSYFEPLTRALAKRRRVPGAETDDNAQTGRIAVQRAAKAYDAEKGNFYAYALRCIANALFDAARRGGRKNDPLRAFVPLEALSDALPYAAPSPEDVFLLREAAEALQKTMDGLLSATEKRAVEERLNGHSYREIALILGVGVKSVDNALKRARKKLFERTE